MRSFMKYVLTFALVLSALGAAASGAMASRGIRLAPSGAGLTITASGVTTLTASGVRVICNLNITLAINGSIAKSAGASAGSVNDATISACNDGSSGTVDNEPIALLYTSFGGTLPSGITAFNGVTAVARFTMTGGVLFGTNRCAYTASSLTVQLSGAANAFTTGRFTGSATSSVTGCPPNASIASGNFVLTGALRSVSVLLV